MSKGIKELFKRCASVVDTVIPAELAVIEPLASVHRGWLPRGEVQAVF